MVTVNSPERLDSWKEIAAYLNRDERTVQRWELECELPVHRTPGRRRGSVFAYRHELDVWLAGRSSVSEKAATSTSAVPSRKNRFVVIVGLVVIAVIAAIIGLVRFTSHTQMAVHVSLVEDRVVGLDELGQQSWEYRLQEPAGWLPDTARYWRSVDLSGKPILLVMASHTRSGGGELDCFSADGKLLWKYEPKMTLRFGSQVDDGPWSIGDFEVVPGSPKPRLWAVARDSIWGHSFIVEIDPATGQAQVRFVNNGSVHVIRSITRDHRSYLLAGGFNNEYDLPMLAVLDPNQSYAVSPQTAGTRFYCENCDRGYPLKYFVMPRSELNRLVARTPNLVQHMDVLGTALHVSTSELSENIRAIYFYSTTPDMLPQSFTLASTYWTEHRRLEREGRVKHPAERCPDYLNPQPVRVWTPGGGWSELHAEYTPKGSIPEK